MSSPCCSSCGVTTAPDAASCPACGALQPLPPGVDLFAVLGLPRRHAVDPAELERRFHERSRLAHPDRHARAPARERRISLERTARLNEAHRTLRHPRRRAAYLVSLLDAGALPAAAAAPAPEFLADQLERRDEIARARSAGDAAALARLAGEARARLAAIDAAVAEALAGDPDAPSIGRAAAALTRARFEEGVLAAAELAPLPEAGG